MSQERGHPMNRVEHLKRGIAARIAYIETLLKQDPPFRFRDARIYELTQWLESL